MSTLLPQLLEEYAPHNIYNADETGLFYKLQPNKSIVFQDEDGRGGKLSKERLTVLPMANMTGTHKLKPLVINKAWKPHAFTQKRVNINQLPVEYHANKKAWMTSGIFMTWLYKLDRMFGRQKRKIALVIDNCPSHPHVKLENIKLVFLPPNTTSKTQPMDQGIIQSFKCHYRTHYVNHGLLKAMERGSRR